MGGMGLRFNRRVGRAMAPLLLLGVLEELVGHRLGVDALRHVVVVLVAERADDLGREHLVEHGEHLRVVEHDAFVDFALLDRRVDEADHAEAFLVAALHRGFHVVGESGFEGHVVWPG